MIYSVVLKGEALLKNQGRDKLKNLIGSKKNLKYMPALEHPAGYFAIMAVMMAIGLSMIAYFKKRGWA